MNESLGEIQHPKKNQDQEFLGTYYCHASNSIGQGEPCKVVLTEAMMEKGLSDEVIVVLIALAVSIIVLLIIIAILVCFYYREKNDNEDKGNYENSELNLFQVANLVSVYRS